MNAQGAGRRAEDCFSPPVGGDRNDGRYQKDPLPGGVRGG